MTSEISSTQPDWAREYKPPFAWHPSKSLLASIRAYQKVAHRPGFFSKIRRKIAVVRHIFWSVVTGADIPISCKIEGGLLLPHPNGVVIHPQAVIGANCLIFQQVTIGGGYNGAPVIDGHVDIGAGAKILGAVRIGSHSKIGANAVVLSDVPSSATAVGIPAEIIQPLHR